MENGNKREDEKWIIIKCEKWEKYDSIIYFILYCIILNIIKKELYSTLQRWGILSIVRWICVMNVSYVDLHIKLYWLLEWTWNRK